MREYKERTDDAFPGSGNLKPQDEEIRRLKERIAELEEENEILKNHGHLRKTPEVTYSFIYKHRSMFRLEKMCQVLDILGSGYYAWIKRPKSNRKKLNEELLKKIKNVYNSPVKLMEA